MNANDLIAEAHGFRGVERSAGGVALPNDNYFCIIPQEDLTITSITIPDGYDTETEYNEQTLAKGIPFYVPFTTATLTGKADCYKTRFPTS